MKTHDGDIRGFYHLSEAWYGPANLSSGRSEDEVTFGFYCPEGGTSGEMSMKWDSMGACLRVWHDAWHTLVRFSSVVVALGEVEEKPTITPKEFCALLLRLGFQDMTPRKNPYAATEKPMRRETMLENTLGALVDAVVDQDSRADIGQHINTAKQLLGRK